MSAAVARVRSTMLRRCANISGIFPPEKSSFSSVACLLTAKPRRFMRGCRGENFSVIEINGIRSGTNRDCDPALPLAEVYRRLADQQRIMFLIGEKNRARGFTPVGCADVLKSLIRQSQFGRRYPASA